MPKINDKTQRDNRRSEAQTRAANHTVRTPQQQLQELDKRLGVNKGATKERARLAALVSG
jgi:hypothetical protein